MVVLGIVGGVASGKSLVAAEFERLGGRRIAADQLGHEVLQDAEVKEQLRSRWGEEVIRHDGEIDRAAVARIVFAASPQAPQERTFLEEITHPRIRAAMQQQVAQLREQGGSPAVILDAALLLEAGWDSICDVIVFVEASPTRRLARARQRGWDEQQFTAREAAQMALNEKRHRADYVIDNEGSRAETSAQIQQLWRRLVARDTPSQD